MNILFLMKVFEIGGQEVVTLTLAKSFVSHGHNVSIACFMPPNPIMVARADKRIKFFTLGEFRYSGKNVKELRSILIDNKIDIVINQWGLPYIPANVLNKAKAKLPHIKTIAIYHNSPDTNARIKGVEIDLEKTQNRLKRLVLYFKKQAYKLVTSLSMRYVYEHSDLYMVLSPSFIDKFKTFTHIKNPEHLSVQTNPVTIDSSDYVYSPVSKQKEIIYVGRIDYNQKRTSRIIETWSLLENKYSDWILRIIGDGEERENLERLCKTLNLQNVFFEGFKQPTEYYKRASVLLLTSEYEGFPLVLPECMSFGVVPVVYGSYSAVYDIINDDQDGLVVPFSKDGFHAEKMAEKISVIMTNEKLRSTMAINAIKKSCNYSIDKIYKQWLTMFNVLLS